MEHRLRYREALRLGCAFTWHLCCSSLLILGLPALFVPRMSAYRKQEMLIAGLLMILAVVPLSFQSLLRDQDPRFRLVIARPAQQAKGLTYLESLQMALVSSVLYFAFIAAFQTMRLADRMSLAGSNLTCFCLLVLAVSPAMVLTVAHFPFRGFRLIAETRSTKAVSAL